MLTDMNQFSLQGRIALVTGASSGIGRTIACALAQAGAQVILCARRTDALQQCCEDLRAQGFEAQVISADLSKRSELKRIGQASAACFGRSPNIVVHAAGVNRRQSWQDITDESWDEQIELMLSVPFFLSRELVPAMMERGWGRIIHIASLQSERAFPNSMPYGAAKGGVMQLTRAMAEAWSAHGITANAIAPGFFPTELTQSVFADKARMLAIAQQTAIGRAGELQDLHGAAVFLASDAARYITGQTLYVDGGFSAK
jgi:NAD(P)-dependent dehydrogenase (short-subunit alcohol dehydrogenase family)